MDRDYCLTECPDFGITSQGCCAGQDYIIVHPEFRPDCPRARPAPDNRKVLSRLLDLERELNRQAADRAIRAVERTEKAKKLDGLAARYTE